MNKIMPKKLGKKSEHYIKRGLLACFHCQKKDSEKYADISIMLGRCPKCKKVNEELYPKIET